MSQTVGALAAGTLLGAAGFWLLLPRGRSRGRAAGAVLAIAALGFFASTLPPVGGWAAESVLHIIAAVTVVAAVATVTFRSPVYCAVWFALTLLGTAGLFLMQGAQFLAVATIVVYAGAIVVTFLFVLMLAQPEGNAYYDRISWEGLLAAGTGAVLIGLLSLAISDVLGSASTAAADEVAAANLAVATVEQRQTPAELSQGESSDPARTVLVRHHMARFGAELFGRHLIAVEVAGTLLLVALVGAVALTARDSQRRNQRE